MSRTMIGAAVVLLSVLYHHRSWSSEQHSCVSVVHRKREIQRQERGDWNLDMKDGDYCPQERREMRELDSLPVGEMLRELRSGKYSLVRHTRMRIHRVCEAGDRYSCVTEQPFVLAMRQATVLENRKNTSSLLWGLPISLKDSFELEGFDTSCGTVARCFLPAEQNGRIVQRLVDHGAIVMAKTNVPQVMMLPESNNRIWGATLNPWNPERTSGGSTGGEGVLLATGVTALGIGSDIGGSLRIPAVWCGVCGFLPSHKRLNAQGSVNVTSPDGCPGNAVIQASIGPMARTVEGLVLGMAALSEPGDWRPHKVERWRRRERLRIGYWEDCSFFEVCPTARRAMRQAVAAMAAQGHEMVPLAPVPAFREINSHAAGSSSAPEKPGIPGGSPNIC